ncbi:MAG: primase small subunit [Thermoplasmata archaeon]|nr:primase small subunit [Thermoplasmata archaeon]
MAGGPPPQEQIDATLAWVTAELARYYAESPPPLPSRFMRREFGFIPAPRPAPERTPFFRHIGIRSAADFRAHLARGPWHCYYSTAYYDKPDAHTMAEKTWRGADLIFDLDADHLPNADKLSYEEQLREVHAQAKKLLRKFLLGDFGFDPEHVHIVFSGGRGYHFHVTDPRVWKLESSERREIVDYLSPNEQVAEWLFEHWAVERSVTRDGFGRLSKEKYVPPSTAPGWMGRLTRGIIDYLDELAQMPRPAAMMELQSHKGIGEATAARLLDWATPEKIKLLRTGKSDAIQLNDPFNVVNRSRHDQILSERIFLPPALQRQAVVDFLIEKAKVKTEGETDEPVTADIKRLIRLPGSLHGKTGLRVTPMGIDEFERFDPLRDAVALSDEPVSVVVSKPADVNLKGVGRSIVPGEQELPLHVAMFLVLRRGALRPLPSAPRAAP